MTSDLFLILRTLFGSMMNFATSFNIPGTFFTPLQLAFGMAFAPFIIGRIVAFVNFRASDRVSSARSDARAEKIAERKAAAKSKKDT